MRVEKKSILRGALLIVALLFSEGVGITKATAQIPINQMAIELAQSLLETPYVAGTLEVNEEETLVVNIDEVDCTTFVEQVTAMAIIPEEERTPESFANMLREMRYRNGEIDGYTSRLHYLSEWIAQCERMGIVSEITSVHPKATPHGVRFSFMSSQSHLYPKLKDNGKNIDSIREIENQLNHELAPLYIPKEAVDSKSMRWVKSGDIIAITSSIQGLDVEHVGFALWVKGKLHLLHASSLAGHVILDPRTLDKQLEASRTQNGIRVIRIL